MSDITPEQLMQSVIDSGLAWIKVRECSVCGSHVGYQVIDNSPYFDSNCGCSSYESELQPRTWDDLAVSINMQPNMEVRKSEAARFGLKLPNDI